MPSDSPSPWEVATGLMGNIGEAQRRAERDSLRLGLVTAGFLVLRFSATDRISVAGVVISDPSIVIYGLLPYAALLALNFVKAQALTAYVAVRLRSHMPSTARLLGRRTRWTGTPSATARGRGVSDLGRTRPVIGLGCRASSG